MDLRCERISGFWFLKVKDIKRFVSDIYHILNKRQPTGYLNSLTHFTSIHVSSIIISIWVRNKILRSGFFGSNTELTHVKGDNPVETLASVVLTTDK